MLRELLIYYMQLKNEDYARCDLYILDQLAAVYELARTEKLCSNRLKYIVFSGQTL